jgi:hypothetical protein
MKTYTTLTAQPGWHVAILVRADGCDEIDIEPIIAWEIERDDEEGTVIHSTIPITLEGDLSDVGNVWGIKTPDGKFWTGDRMVDDEPAVIKALQERREFREKMKAKAVERRLAAVKA